jgi:hypothetical protein
MSLTSLNLDNRVGALLSEPEPWLSTDAIRH